MDRRIVQVAKEIGAKHRGTLPEIGGGAFGMARLAQALRAQLTPSVGKRPGRPTNQDWTKRYKVPMSAQTLASLEAISTSLSTSERRISPMQVAANLLEQGVSAIELRRSTPRRKKLAKARGKAS